MGWTKQCHIIFWGIFIYILHTFTCGYIVSSQLPFRRTSSLWHFFLRFISRLYLRSSSWLALLTSLITWQICREQQLQLNTHIHTHSLNICITRTVAMVTHLLLCLDDGLVQHVRKLLHLPLQAVVITGQSAQGRLQGQQVHTNTCTGWATVAWGVNMQHNNTQNTQKSHNDGRWAPLCKHGHTHLPGSRAPPSSRSRPGRRPPRSRGSSPPPGSASRPPGGPGPSPSHLRTPGSAPTHSFRTGLHQLCASLFAKSLCKIGLLNSVAPPHVSNASG